jgi:predicted nucleotidyltransferase
MGITLTDILKERKEEKQKYFKNYLFYAKKIKDKAEEILGDCRVFVFGSILKGDYHPVLSDIDILIISSRSPANSEQKAKIKVKILSEFEMGNPFEIHIITPDDYQNWYSKFIKEKAEIY